MDSVLKAVGGYLVLWVVIRITGRRSLGQMTAFDFILYLVVGSTMVRSMVGEDYSLTNGIIIIVTLAMLNVGTSLLETHFASMGKVIKGTPTVLVERGRVLHDRVRKARVTEDEILAAARTSHGLVRMQQIRYAVLEASGAISIVPE